MTRFDTDYDGEGMPWELWETVVSNALGGRRGQEALAAMEEALFALPEPKLIEGRLASDGGVCAIGAFVAHRRAQDEGVDLPAIIAAMGTGVSCWCGHGRDAHSDAACSGKLWQDRPCSCTEYEPEDGDAYETVEAGQRAGLTHTVAWHLAYLNDEQLAGYSEADRFEKMLAFVRRAQGKEASVAA